MTLQTTGKSFIEVNSYLDELLQVTDLDRDSNGLVVGGRPVISKVGLAVNCSFQVIEGASQRNCDLLITHHPAWPDVDMHLSEQKYNRLRQMGLNYYAAHESLDLARDLGTADALARAVRVTTQGPLKLDGESEFGIHGLTMGNLAEFVLRVGSQLGTEPRRWKNSDSFGHVAIVPGWGGRTAWMAQAQSSGCDTFLTGETSMFGILFAKETGLNLIVAGHYATEVPGVMALSARIARDLGLDVTFIPEEIVETRG